MLIKSTWMITFLFFMMVSNSHANETVFESKEKGKVSIVRYQSVKGKQSLTLRVGGKELYQFMANPPEASMIDSKVVKFKNYPRKVLLTHWLLGVKNQRVVIFDFNRDDSPILFDLSSDDEMSYKVNQDNLEVTYITYPNSLDAIDYSSQTIRWSPKQ